MLKSLVQWHCQCIRTHILLGLILTHVLIPLAYTGSVFSAPSLSLNLPLLSSFSNFCFFFFLGYSLSDYNVARPIPKFNFSYRLTVRDVDPSLPSTASSLQANSKGRNNKNLRPQPLYDMYAYTYLAKQKLKMKDKWSIS